MTTSRSTTPSINVSFRDILEGRAYLRIPAVGKLLLVHLAGAPWVDRNPNAYLHPLQVEVLFRREREKIVHGASRLGKSVLGGCECVIDGMVPGTNTAVVAARYDHVSHEWQYLYKGMRRLFRDHLGVFIRLVYKHSQSNHEYDYQAPWNSHARGYSTDSDEGAALLGREFTRAVFGEGSHIAPDILDKKVLRALDGARMNQLSNDREIGHLSIYTTPKGFEGSSAAEYERIMMRTGHQPEKVHFGEVSWASTAWIKEANILENPAYDQADFENRKTTLSKAAFEEQYLGRMTFASGRIYPEYQPSTHVVSMPDRDTLRKMKFGVGIDTGAYFGASLVGLLPGDTDKTPNATVLGEVYTQQSKTMDSCDELREMVIDVLSPAFGTEDWGLLKERVELWCIDPASQHKIDINDYLDITVTYPNRGQGKFDLLPTLDLMRTLFSENRLKLVEGLTYTDDQIRKYVWKHVKAIGATKNANRAPVIREPKKEYDHILDALRFITIPLVEEGAYEEEPPALTVQEEWARRKREMIHKPLRDILEEAERRGGMWS